MQSKLNVTVPWEVRLAGRGEMVRVVTDSGERTGRFVGVDADGALILETANGQERILVGDVALGPRPRATAAPDDTIL